LQQSYPIAFYLLATAAAAVTTAVYILLLVDVAKVICLCNEHSTQLPLHPSHQQVIIERPSNTKQEFLWTRKRRAEQSSSYYPNDGGSGI
jgi:hypothetical protein